MFVRDKHATEVGCVILRGETNHATNRLFIGRKWPHCHLSDVSDVIIRKAWPVTIVAEFAGRSARAPPVFQPRISLSAGPEGCASDRKSCPKRTGSLHVFAPFSFQFPIPPRLGSDAGCHPPPRQEHTSDRKTMDSLGSRCKIVVVGDTQCGKTALLHVFAKDCYPEVCFLWVYYFHSLSTAYKLYRNTEKPNLMTCSAGNIHLPESRDSPVVTVKWLKQPCNVWIDFYYVHWCS